MKFLELLNTYKQILNQIRNLLMGAIFSLFNKLYKWFFPDDYSISLHHSHINIQTLFKIRVIAFIYLSLIFIWTMIFTKSVLNVIIYLTMNGYFYTWLYFTLIVQDHYLNVHQITTKSGKGYPICNNLKYYIQLIYQIAFSVQLPITLVFWTVLFKILINLQDITTQQILLNVNLHAGPIICLLIEVGYNTCQFPLKHFTAVVGSSVVYLFINLTYSLSVKPIYQPIDWISFFSYVLLLVSVVLTYSMHWFGRFLYRRYKKKKLENRIMEGLIEGNYEKNDNQLKRENQGQKKEEDLNISVLTDDL